MTDLDLTTATNDELNRAIAEEVMGWEFEIYETEHKAHRHPSYVDKAEGIRRWASEWSPSTDMNDAMRVVAKMHERFDLSFTLEVEAGDAKQAKFYRDVERVRGHIDCDMWWENDNDPPRAICLAALQAVRSLKENAP